MEEKQTFGEDLGTFAMPLLESDASFVDKELQPQVSEASEAQQFNLDSAMASPPRESRELNEYLLKWSNETKLLAPVDTSKCKSVSEPSTPKGAEESNMAVSYIQSNDLQHNNIELENVMGQHDYARKRRRSFSSPSDYELNADDLTPLLIRELSVSPSRFRQQHTVGLPTKDERTGGLERGDTKDSDTFDDEPVPVQNVEYLDEYVIDDKNTWVYSNFLKAHACYDIIPHSSKIVVFDTRLRVKKAFFALVYNGIRSAPVWDASKHEFVGMLTISDFISILRCYYKSPLVGMSELEEHKIETWREISKADLKPKLIRISPTANLHDAVRMLVENKIHRLPVIDPATGNALFVLTHKKILRYLYSHFDDMAMPDFMGYSLSQIGIGTHQDIATVYPDTSVIEAFNIFAERRVSALPVVNKRGQVVDVYARFDVIENKRLLGFLAKTPVGNMRETIRAKLECSGSRNEKLSSQVNLAAERTYNNLDVSVSEALLHRQEGFEGVHKCYLHETFYAVIVRIVGAKVHRLVVVDKDDCVLGIISLSDILKFLVLAPVTQEQQTLMQTLIGTPVADMEI